MNRRNFLKVFGVGVAGMTLVTAFPVIPTKEIAVYDHPEVIKTLKRFPNSLLPNEKKIIADFIMNGVDQGWWFQMDAMYWHGMNDEENALTNWLP